MNEDALVTPTLEPPKDLMIDLSDIEARRYWCSTRRVDFLTEWEILMANANAMLAFEGDLAPFRFVDITEENR